MKNVGWKTFGLIGLTVFPAHARAQQNQNETEKLYKAIDDFVAPAVADHTLIAESQTGTIVFDLKDDNFYAKNNVGGSAGWYNLSSKGYLSYDDSGTLSISGNSAKDIYEYSPAVSTTITVQLDNNFSAGRTLIFNNVGQGMVNVQPSTSGSFAVPAGFVQRLICTTGSCATGTDWVAERVPAGVNQSGYVSTTSQTFAGNKEFAGKIKATGGFDTAGGEGLATSTSAGLVSYEDSGAFTATFSASTPHTVAQSVTARIHRIGKVVTISLPGVSAACSSAVPDAKTPASTIPTNYLPSTSTFGAIIGIDAGATAGSFYVQIYPSGAIEIGPTTGNYTASSVCGWQPFSYSYDVP